MRGRDFEIDQASQPAARKGKGAITQTEVCSAPAAGFQGAVIGKRPDIFSMIHPASHCPLLVLSRSDGRSSVAAAAYAARTKMTDQRTGLSYNYRYTPGLLAEGQVNWNLSVQELWNAAERSEKRVNSRVARELRPALPVELPLDEQRRLVHGFSCWLKDEFGVAVHWVVHAPTFLKKTESKILWRNRKSEAGQREYLNALMNPEMTNLNFHAHIRFTTRRVDGKTGEFFEKTRALDDKKTGAECVMKIRAEWEKRTNAALAREGSDARIDLRSYDTMAAAGDAPTGLTAQKHLGPKQTARGRRTGNGGNGAKPHAVAEREAVQSSNQEQWRCWLEIRRLEREKDRLLIAVKLADEREEARRERTSKEKRRIAEAKTAADQRDAVEAATSIDRIGNDNDALAAALAWARSGAGAPGNAPDANRMPSRDGQTTPGDAAPEWEDFNEEIDPETFVSQHVEDPPYRLRRIRRQSHRGRGQRVRD